MSMIIGRKGVGQYEPVFVIAEISANHNQSLDKAKQLVREAARVGADAVKTQTYTAASMTVKTEAPWGRCNPRTIWAGELLYDLYERAYMPPEWNAILQEEADCCGIEYLSTAYDRWSAWYLADLGIAAIKIASFELTDYDLLQYIGLLGMPAILSTGMARWDQVERAMRALQASEGARFSVALLHCVSEYPAKRKDLNLSRIRLLEELKPKAIGFSDHTPRTETAAAAVLAGAQIIEKHFMLDGTKSPDSEFSMTPSQFAKMVSDIRVAEEILGSDPHIAIDKCCGSATCKRSVFSTRLIKKGETLGHGNTRTARPLAGLPADDYPEVLGTRADQDIPAGMPVLRSMLNENIELPR